MSRLAGLLLVAAALAACGCVTAQARVEPGGPALVPPDPPPHTVNPVTLVEAPPAQTPPEGPAPVVVAKEDPPAARRQKPVEKPAEKPPDAVPAPPVAPPAPPLQTTANVDEKARAIRERMSQARAHLSRVNEAALNADRRLQFDTAKRFLEQAEDALKVQNLLFAEELANKAATLAEALAQK